MNSNLYVGNLPFSATEENVTALFTKYGKLKSVNIIKDKYTGQAKGFGFVEFENQADAQRALELDGKDFNGRTLKVNMAKPKEAGGGGSRGGRGGKGGYGRGGRDRDSRW